MSASAETPAPESEPEAATPSTLARALTREDVNVGLAVMQTVYAVAMVLGFKNALERSYGVFVSPLEGPQGGLPHPVLILALAAIMLLGLRFFWVPRNLYAYVLKPLSDSSKLQARMRIMTAVHFPIVLVHALLFFAVCEAYVDLVKSNASLASGLVVTLTGRFVFLFAGLLLVNGVWLLATFGVKLGTAEGRWALSNVVFGLLALLDALLVLEVFEASVGVLAISVSILFLLNGAIDLIFASKWYIEFPDGDKPIACCIDRDPRIARSILSASTPPAQSGAGGT
jgi:hypothetical protein